CFDRWDGWRRSRWDRLGRLSRYFDGLFNSTCPHETSALIIDHRVRVEEFFLQRFKSLVIQVELGFERSIGRPPSLLEEGDHPVEDIIEVHYRPSSNSSNNALASLRSAVSNPSVNQLYTGASRSWASWHFPCCCQSRARLVAARNSKDLTCWLRAMSRA